MPRRPAYTVKKNDLQKNGLIFKNRKGQTWLESYRTKSGLLISRQASVLKGQWLLKSEPLNFKRK